MKWRHFLLAAAVWLFCCQPSVLAGSKLGEYQAAKDIYMANVACVAVYNDNIAYQARQELVKSGCEIEAVREVIDDVSIKYCLIKNRSVDQNDARYMLAISGTEDKSDMNIDFDLKKVAFGGASPKEFIAYAEKEPDKTQPAVHRGFNRYVQRAFFTPDENGQTFADEVIEKINAAPDFTLEITGHSLGGAVGVLFAARLVDMGVDSSRIKVTTFGAPEIGNAAFCEKYDGLISIKRIAMSGDIIKHVLKTVAGDYRHIGTEIKWKRDALARGIDHSVYVYLDRAIRNYYAAAEKENKAVYKESRQPLIVVAPLAKDLAYDLKKDSAYLETAENSALDNAWHSKCYFAKAGEDAFLAARDMGASYVISRSLYGERVKDKRQSIYKLENTVFVYDAKTGGLLGYYQDDGASAELSPLVLTIQQTAKIASGVKTSLNLE
jgi:hypothetical protein